MKSATRTRTRSSWRPLPADLLETVSWPAWAVAALCVVLLVTLGVVVAGSGLALLF